jgi:hypothetical protein
MVILDTLFERQLSFLLDLVELNSLSTAEKHQLSKEYILHAHAELFELLNEFPSWRTWLGTSNPVPNIDGMTEEIVDTVKFLMNILLLWNVKVETFAEIFNRKTDVNIQRFTQHRQLAKLMSKYQQGVRHGKVAAIDLDGVLASYPESWLTFLANETGVSVDVKDFSLSFGTMSIPRGRYAALKERYRREGGESRVGILSGAVEFLRNLRLLGYYIIILSSRPVKQYKRLYSDSIMWLQKYQLPFDVVVWERDKEDWIIQSFPIVDFVVEDDPLNAERIGASGIKTYLLDRPYNQGIDGRFRRVESLAEILEIEGR